MRVRISCRDGYEAQKLASLIFIRESGETYVEEILDVFGSELVVKLKDKSAHSIVLKNAENVDAFADFIQSVLEGGHSISGTETSGGDVEITKS